MLRYAFSLLFLLTFAAVFGQNKKQQLETLTARYDSLTAVLVTERATSTRSINALTTSVEQLTTQIESLTAEIARLNSDKRANQLKLNTATEQLALLTAQLMQKNDTIKQLKAPPSLKRKTLTSLVGTHPLMAISASAGANTLLDFYKENGKWTADGSSIHQAQREGFDIELIQDDYDKLASYTITVQADLTVVIACKNKPYFTIPFNDNGMLFDLNTANDYLMLPPNLSETTTFQADKLFLFATDKITEAVSSELTVNEMYIGNAAYLFYDNKEKTFELFFFNGDPTSFVFQ
jgi:outer membrane murein-binding lipoprotein Lpp